jgi:hypothetical protein
MAKMNSVREPRTLPVVFSPHRSPIWRVDWIRADFS